MAGPFGALRLAGFQTKVQQIMPFGLGFDFGSPAAFADSNVGFEGWLDVAIPRTAGALSLEGWYTRFVGELDRPYAPRDVGRLALVLHQLFYDGQLEPSARLEANHRGIALVPLEPGASLVSPAPGYQTLHFSLHLRILDVTAFLLWDNFLYAEAARDFPVGPRAFPRIVYGASWEFSN